MKSKAQSEASIQEAARGTVGHDVDPRCLQKTFALFSL